MGRLRRCATFRAPGLAMRNRRGCARNYLLFMEQVCKVSLCRIDNDGSNVTLIGIGIGGAWKRRLDAARNYGGRYCTVVTCTASAFSRQPFWIPHLQLGE